MCPVTDSNHKSPLRLDAFAQFIVQVYPFISAYERRGLYKVHTLGTMYALNDCAMRMRRSECPGGTSSPRTPSSAGVFVSPNSSACWTRIRFFHRSAQSAERREWRSECPGGTSSPPYPSSAGVFVSPNSSACWTRIRFFHRSAQSAERREWRSECPGGTSSPRTPLVCWGVRFAHSSACWTRIRFFHRSAQSAERREWRSECPGGTYPPSSAGVFVSPNSSRTPLVCWGVRFAQLFRVSYTHQVLSSLSAEC